MTPRTAPAPALPNALSTALPRILAATLVAALVTTALAPWPLARAQTTADPLPAAEARRADLARFRSDFLARDRAYTRAARQQAGQRLDSLEARAADIDDTRFALELAQVAALADNGHTWAYGGPRMARTNRVGLRLAPFGSDFVVLRARQADTDLLGARLVSVDGVPLERLREAAHSLTGGPPAWRDRQAPLFIESPEQLHALGLARAAESAVFVFRTDDGRRVERRLAGEPPGPARPIAEVHRLLLPEVTPDQDAGADTGWRGLLPLASAPRSLRDARQPLRWRAAPELDALVVDMRRTFSRDDAPLPAFFEVVREAIARHQPRHLVLDLRLNGGGDLTQARDFAQSLPTLVNGTVFVLTSPATFSAAISVAGYLKQAAPQRVRIVGEAVGDRLEFFAEGRPVTLAHSGLVLLPATERHDYRDGCRAHTDCHAWVVRHPIAVASLDPDIAAPWTLQAYRRGEDPAMEAVADALRGDRPAAR